MADISKKPISWFLKEDVEKGQEGFTRKNRNKRVREILGIAKKFKVAKGLTPEAFRLFLEELGPTFVKAGQVLSMRSEILPKSFTDELTKLRAQVSPLSYELVLKTLEYEYNKPLDTIFSHIEAIPEGSASVAQVHRAKLVSGEEVAIKVQRPGVKEVMSQDISIMKSLVSLINVATPKASIIDLEEVIDELWKTFQEETDFLQEAYNLKKFAEINKNAAYISCPKPFLEYCTENVVVMEYIDGIAISDTKALEENGYSLAEIGLKLVDNYTSQVLDDGYFHGDPHPGNIIIKDGKIVYIDLGMMGTLSKRDALYLKDIIYSVGQQDVSKLKDALLNFAIEKDSSKINHGQFLSDLDSIMSQFGTMDLKELDVGNFLNELFSLAQRNYVVMPSSASMISKGFVTLEGVLDECLPETNIIQIITAHIANSESIDERASSEIQELARKSRNSSLALMDASAYTPELFKMLTRGQLKFNMEVTGSEKPLAVLRSMVDRLTLSMVIAGLFIGSSIVYISELPPKLFGVPVLGFLGYLGAFVLSVWVVSEIFISKRKQ